MNKSIAVVGGDMRQVYLARLLSEDGNTVMTCGLERGDAPFADSALEIHNAELVILPIPVFRGGEFNCPLSEKAWSADDLFSQLHCKQTLLGGMTSSIPLSVKEKYPVDIIDYYSREEVQIENAVPTAEGAIMRAIMETNISLQECNCLVVGYGRIGKILSHRLRAIEAAVTVAARKISDRAWSEAYGYRSIEILQLREMVHEFDVIFNTVPTMLFDKTTLDAVKSDCLLVELASHPGGFDLKTVKENNLRVIDANGLPGKISPVSAARTIKKAIYQIMQERGVVL